MVCVGGRGGEGGEGIPHMDKVGGVAPPSVPSWACMYLCTSTPIQLGIHLYSYTPIQLPIGVLELWVDTSQTCACVTAHTARDHVADDE